MSDKKKDTTSASAAEPAPLLSYEVMVDQVKIGKVIAFRTARVNLTKAQADTLNEAQPDTVRFLGI